MTRMDHAVVGGVFHDGDAARRAAEELRRVGFPEDQINATARKGAFGFDGAAPEGRTVVTVRAPGRYEEASAILRRHGGAVVAPVKAPASVPQR